MNNKADPGPDHTAADKAPEVAPIAKPEPPLDPVHQAMHDIVTLVETLARHVPTAHSLGAAVLALRDKIDAAWTKKK